jgi:hypothetical protein
MRVPKLPSSWLRMSTDSVAGIPDPRSLTTLSPTWGSERRWTGPVLARPLATRQVFGVLAMAMVLVLPLAARAGAAAADGADRGPTFSGTIRARCPADNSAMQSIVVALGAAHDAWEVKSARLARDKKTVLLEIPELKPVDQLHIRMILKGANGTEFKQALRSTVHKTKAKAIASIR